MGLALLLLWGWLAFFVRILLEYSVWWMPIKLRVEGMGCGFLRVWLTLYFTRRRSFGIALLTSDRSHLKKALKSSGYSKTLLKKLSIGIVVKL